MQRALRIEHVVGDVEGDFARIVRIGDLEAVKAREEELAEFLAVSVSAASNAVLARAASMRRRARMACSWRYLWTAGLDECIGEVGHARHDDVGLMRRGAERPAAGGR